LTVQQCHKWCVGGTPLLSSNWRSN